MKRGAFRAWMVVLAVVLLGAVALFGAWCYAERALEQRLAEFADTLRDAGGDWQHRDSGLTTDGQLEVHQVQLRLPEQPEPYHIARLTLASDGWPGLIRAALAARDRQLPEALRFTVHGLEWPEAADETLPGIGAFAAAGCAGRTALQGADLRGMGYAPAVLDAKLLYRFAAVEHEPLKLMLELHWRDAYQLRWEASGTLSSATREPYALAGALMSATLDESRLSYRDEGLTERRLAFCAKAMGLESAPYQQHHSDLWQEVWARYGWRVGPPVLEAYRQFLRNPKTAELVARPTQPLYISRLVGTPPSTWFQALGLSLSVNREAVEPDLQPTDAR